MIHKYLISRILIIIIPITFAIIFFIFHFSNLPIHPLESDKVFMTNSNDYIQAFLGWHYFKNDAWYWPLGLIKNYSYLMDTTITYTDSIPLLAVLLKIFNPLLPDTFNYLGIVLIINYILQASFATLLLRQLSCSKIVSIIGSLFFIFSPILFQRASVTMHIALSCHWVILAALCIYFSKQSFSFIKWSFLLLISIGIHFYICAMIFFVFFSDSLKHLVIKKDLKTVYFCIYLVFISLVSFLLMYSLGYFNVSNPSAGGLGRFSMNILAPFFPLNIPYVEGINEHFFFLGLETLNSFKMPGITTARVGQFEGFNYLGSGILILLISTLIQSFKYQKSIVQKLKQHWPLLLSILILIMASISPLFSVGSFSTQLNYPNWLINYWSILRASGRLFWPVYYLLIILAVVSVSRIYQKKMAILIICLCLSIQYWDFQNFYKVGQKKLDQNITEVATQWAPLVKDNQLIFHHISKQNYAILNAIIYKNRNKQNLIQAARYDLHTLVQKLNEEKNLFLTNSAKKNTLYIFNPNALNIKKILNLDYNYQYLDPFYIFTAKNSN